MLKELLARAEADEPVYITDVRAAFQAEGTRPFHLHVTLYDGSVRVFPLTLPEWETGEEAAFAASYVHGMIYNILSSLGAARIDIYLDPRDEALLALAEGLDGVFQTKVPKLERTGYGKCLNVNERVLAALFSGDRPFAFHILDAAGEPAAEPPAGKPAGMPVFASLPQAAADKLLLGIDVGGTDIKLTASVKGRLCLCKEYDWFPEAFTRAEQLTGPILLLVRLMRAGAGLYAAGKEALVDGPAFRRNASPAEMKAAAERMEAQATPRNFDAIGLSFPDVVIQGRIVGGETPKTSGMRKNRALDYDEEFGKLTALCGALKAFVTADGAVMITNDGNMAAFTAAVEQAAAGRDISAGFFAHTLGTDLGTGWVRPDGSIPGIPLEVYNFIIDLGSFGQRRYAHGDVRSIANSNTDLPGSLQKYTGQSAVFRLAAKYLPAAEPDTWREALARGCIQRQGEVLAVPAEPRDMRKPCLEFFMEKAGEPGHDACADIFRRIGEYLAVTWQETDYILRPEAGDRSLFGRMVKHPACFALLREGAQRRAPGLALYAADADLANTALMRQLEASPDHSVAQFAQAVGAMYYGCLGLLQGGTI